MSIGNLKDTGNQGNNLPFQWKVLQGLQSIITNALNVNIVNPLGQQKASDSVSTVLAAEQANGIVQAGFRRFTNSDSDLTGFPIILSVSFASVGTANAKISTDAGSNYTDLAPGETLNLEAGAVMNYYEGTNIYWDTTTNAGAALLVAYNYI
jgi:hypothetical protein